MAGIRGTSAPRVGVRASGLVVTGLVATAVAMVLTTLAAALARAAGVDLVVAEGEESVPLAGFAVVTGVFSVVGVVLALALRRWSVRPAERFVPTTVTLTALSLVAPFLSAADGATTVVLVVLHLLAAGVMIPALAHGLSGTTGWRRGPRPRRARRSPR